MKPDFLWGTVALVIAGLFCSQVRGEFVTWTAQTEMIPIQVVKQRPNDARYKTQFTAMGAPFGQYKSRILTNEYLQTFGITNREELLDSSFMSEQFTPIIGHVSGSYRTDFTATGNLRLTHVATGDVERWEVSLWIFEADGFYRETFLGAHLVGDGKLGPYPYQLYPGARVGGSSPFPDTDEIGIRFFPPEDPPAVSETPEPSSLLLACLGLSTCGAVLWFRRRNVLIWCAAGKCS